MEAAIRIASDQPKPWYEELFNSRFSDVPHSSTKSLRVAVAIITAIMAQRILDHHNKKNRRRSHSNVTILAAAILDDEWSLTGQPIIFDEDGCLLDGQHRLEAIVLSGLAVPVLVVIGVDRQSFEYMDQGKKRSLGDVLGITGKADSETVAAAVPFLQSFLRRGVISHLVPAAIDRLIGTRQRFVNDHPGIANSAEVIRNAGRKSRILRSRGLGAAIHYILHTADVPPITADVPLAKEFFAHLLSWAIPPEEEWAPLLQLFKKLISLTTESKRYGIEYVPALIIKTWNAICAGKSSCKLSYGDPEDFPRVTGIVYENGIPVLQPW